MDTNFSCGERIKELRIDRGLSQEKLALNAGITPAYLGLLERGKRNATVLIIEKICDALNISLAEFFSVTQRYTFINNEFSSQVIQRLSKIPAYEQEAILQIIDDIIRFRDKIETTHSNK